MIPGKWAMVMSVLMLPMAWGHAMDQVRAELEPVEGGWKGSVWFEAWAAYPEDGIRVPPGEPGDPGVAGKAWIDTLQPEDFEVMRENLDEFLHYSFVLTLDGERLGFDLSFPDFATDPPVFPENAEGNAVVRVDLAGKFPQGVSGSLDLVWKDDEDQPLAIDVIVPREGKSPGRRVMRVAPNDDPIELMTVDAVSGVEEGKGISLFGWIVAGFEHILPKGLDHILFILGLFFLKPKIRPLLSQTVAFTIAHSITLALVVLGVFAVGSRFVESMIALSIAYVGIENLWVKELKPWRIAFVFALGLLHGMGFASVMQELEIPEGAIIEPLVGFNVGVEAGQVAVLIAAFAVWWSVAWILGRLQKGPQAGEKVARRMRGFSMVASAAIGVTGLYWTFERAFG